jgi:anti-sigma regulatory factor (Ser/Thr protein kinase)
MQKAVTLKIELPNLPDIELVAIEGLERLAKAMGAPSEKVAEARLVVTEAIINGLEHGGEENPRVDVEFIMTKKELTIFVRDYGSGFTPSSVEEPKIAKKLGTGHKRGWGLQIMKSMSDDFRIDSSHGGTRITIKKILS